MGIRRGTRADHRSIFGSGQSARLGRAEERAHLNRAATMDVKKIGRNVGEKR
jgi:hypothetical protein